jgi:dUTP pyrophosphatase
VQTVQNHSTRFPLNASQKEAARIGVCRTQSTKSTPVMTRAATPPPSTQQSDHIPPSLPNSPLAKRPKTAAATMAPSATVPEPDPPTVPKLSTSSQPPLLIKKLSEKATTPTRGSAFAAGYDIYSAHDTVVPARGKTLVDTDLAIAVPEGTCTKTSRLTCNRRY